MRKRFMSQRMAATSRSFPWETVVSAVGLWGDGKTESLPRSLGKCGRVLTLPSQFLRFTCGPHRWRDLWQLAKE